MSLLHNKCALHTCIYVVYSLHTTPHVYVPNMCMWYYYSIIFILYRRNCDLCGLYGAPFNKNTNTHIYCCNIWKLWLDLDIWDSILPPVKMKLRAITQYDGIFIVRIYSFILFPYALVQTTNHWDEFAIRQTRSSYISIYITWNILAHWLLNIFLWSCNRFDFFSHRKSRSYFCLNEFNDQ